MRKSVSICSVRISRRAEYRIILSRKFKIMASYVMPCYILQHISPRGARRGCSALTAGPPGMKSRHTASSLHAHLFERERGISARVERSLHIFPRLTALMGAPLIALDVSACAVREIVPPRVIVPPRPCWRRERPRCKRRDAPGSAARARAERGQVGVLEHAQLALVAHLG
mgnify:CR=1 FL=1